MTKCLKSVNQIESDEAAQHPPDHFAAYHDFHADQPVIVCGCGESLNDLEHPERFITIGVNDVGRRFDPAYLVVLNPRSQFKGDRFRYIETSRAQAIFTQLDLGIRHKNIVKFKLGKRGGTELGDPDTLPYTQNSPYVALCLAAHMGAKRIGLIGVDFTDHHFFGKTGRHALAGKFADIDSEYRNLGQKLLDSGITIYNLSRQSRLTAFEKMSIEDFYQLPKVVAFVKDDTPPKTKIFFVNYKFLSCGDVFRTGLNHAANDLEIEHSDAYWDDPSLPQKIDRFRPDLIFVVHGRKFSQRWGTRFKKYNTAVWLLDEPYEVDDTSRFSSNFDTVFVNDPSTIHRHHNACYLPVGFDPQVYRPEKKIKKYNVGFIGGYNSVRQKFLENLSKRGLLTYVIGGPWKGELQRVCLYQNIPAIQTAEYYQQTKIIINVFREVHHYNRQKIPSFSLNPRIYEALACGALVISEERPELKKIFPELPFFNNNEDLTDHVENYLSNGRQYQNILSKCSDRLINHTYKERLKLVLAFTMSDTNYTTKKNTAKEITDQQPNRSNHQKTLPPGWLNYGDIVKVLPDNSILFDKPHSDKPGSEFGMVSKNAYTEVELSFELLLSTDTKFIAKINQQRQYDQKTNSYHLFCQPNHTYVAKHYSILFEIEITRNTWQEIKLRRFDQNVELYLNGGIAGRAHDIQIQSGFCFLGVKGGSAKLRNISILDLCKIQDKCETEAFKSHIDKAETLKKKKNTAFYNLPVASLPFKGVPTRNLLFHIWPVKGKMWLWNIGELKKRIDIFNGRRVIGIVYDNKSESPDAVMEALDGYGCEFITKPNDLIGESVIFPEIVQKIASCNPEEVTFYAHAKGVKYEPKIPYTVKRWTDALYCTNLDDWIAVRRQLEQFAFTGAFKMLGRFRTHQNLGDWHYSGTFFWMRNVHVFHRDCLQIHKFYGAVEAWPGIYFKESETGCLFLDKIRQLPYHQQFWRSIADPALINWKSNIEMIDPPEDLLSPIPFEDYNWPRTEQKPNELSWWIKLLLDNNVRQLLTIGALNGGVEWHVARVFHKHHRDIEITTIDKDISLNAKEAFQNAQERFGQSMRLIQTDSSANDTKHLLSPQYDAIFIDGDHGYCGARNDWLLAKSKKPKLIGFHDIVDSDWHIQCRCCVSRLWSEIKTEYKTEERSSGEWGGIGVVWL